MEWLTLYNGLSLVIAAGIGWSIGNGLQLRSRVQRLESHLNKGTE
jgi:hypothetical protein